MYMAGAGERGSNQSQPHSVKDSNHLWSVSLDFPFCFSSEIVDSLYFIHIHIYMHTYNCNMRNYVYHFIYQA